MTLHLPDGRQEMSDLEVRIPVQSFLLRLHCPKCKLSYLNYTGDTQPAKVIGNSPIHIHRCEGCNHRMGIIGKIYPRVDHVPTVTEDGPEAADPDPEALPGPGL